MDRRIRIVSRLLRRRLGGALLEALAPRGCAACGGATQASLCPRCRPLLERLEALRSCLRCGEPLPPGGSRCIADHRWLLGVRDLHVAWRYRGAGGAVVRRHKFERDPAALCLAVEGLAAHLAARSPLPAGGWRWDRALFLAVPGSRRRLRRRGFDHAVDLARSVAERVEGGFEAGVLRRIRDTLPQADPRVLSRARNVAGAFRVVRPRAVAGRHVVLTDDVVTSGATVRACAAALRRAGAGRISVAAVARGSLQDEEEAGRT